MSLPWFGFNIKDFIANTARLDTEAKGAYLMLLLDYYQQEQGAPDVARVLATITGLSLEKWLEHSEVILPLFEIRDGRLWHARCEEEIAKGRKLYEQRLAAGAASVAARAVKRAGKRAVERETNGRTEQNVAGSAHSKRQVNEPLPGPLNEALDPIRALIHSFAEPLNERGNERSTQEQEQIEEVGTNVPTSAQAFPAPLDPEFKLTAEDVIRCQNDGATAEQIGAVFDGWRIYHLSAGTMDTDWKANWWRRWERDKPVVTPKPKPRLEVSNRKAKGVPLPEDWQPNVRHAGMAAERGILGRDFDDLVETFRDYCAQAANRTKYSDHNAAFRTFIKNQKTFNRGTHGQAPRRAPAPNRGSIVSAADEALANIDRAIEAAESGDGEGEAPLLPVPGKRLRQPEGGSGGDGDGA